MRTGKAAAMALSAVILTSTFAAPVHADDWPQWRGPMRDGAWRESGIVERFDKPRIKPVWTAEIAGGYCGPTVADGLVYVMDRLVSPKQTERIHCFDAKTGEKKWTHEYPRDYRIDYDAGPRASVTIDDGRAYALGSMGDFHCLDAKTGKILWMKDLDTEYKIRMPIWGIAAAPLIEGPLVIVQIGGEGEACLVAFDKKSGKEAWRSFDDTASYSAPVIFERGGRRVLVCYTGAHVISVDPKTGKLHWSVPFAPKKMVIGITSPVLEGDYLFVSNFFDGSLMLRLSSDGTGVEELWRRGGPSEMETDSLHAIISTPWLRGDYIYGVDSYGELRCLDAKTGDRIWESDKAVRRDRWSTIHFVWNEPQQRMWMFNEEGDLIIARLTPKGYEEISRTHILKPTRDQLPSRRGGVCWSHPAFAGKHVYARNDKELICVDLAK